MSDSVNTSRLRELAVRGKNFREDLTVEYVGEELNLVLKPIIGKRFLPIAAVLEDKLDMDADEAHEKLEEEKESGDDQSIDPAKFDLEFIEIMSEIAVRGIDTTEGDAEGEDEDGLREIFAISGDDEDDIGLIGGATLRIAEGVLDISSDAEKAEKFRRDGGGE